MPLLLLAALALPDLVEEVAPAVVNVSIVRGEETPWGHQVLEEVQGSGFMARTPGFVVTNQHLVEGARAVWVTLADDTIVEARIEGVDPVLDLAVLQIPLASWVEPPPDRDLEAEPLRRGEDLFSIGNPYGLGASVARGIVGATGRIVESAAGTRWGLVQTDMAINPGNSGGPILDAEGRVVAMAAGRLASGSQGIGFGIPIDRVRTWSGRIMDGDAAHGWLGTRVREVWLEEDLARSLGVSRRSLVVVESLPLGGLRVGDLLLAVDGVWVEGLGEALALVDPVRPPGSVRVVVWRDSVGKTISLSAPVTSRPVGQSGL